MQLMSLIATHLHSCLYTIQANQFIQLCFWLLVQIGVAISSHAMTSYCIFSLRTTLHKLDALQKLDGRQRMQGLLADELLTPALQNTFEEISSPYPSRRNSLRKPLPWVSPMSIPLSSATIPPGNDTKSVSQLPEASANTEPSASASTSIAGNGGPLHAGQRIREQLESIPPLISREESSACI